MACANSGQEAGPIGASTSCVVDAVLVDGGVRAPTFTQVEVVLLDVAEDLVSHLNRSEVVEDIAFAFDPDSPYALPDPTQILRTAHDLVMAAGEETGLAFYSADGHHEDGANSGEESRRSARSPLLASARKSKRLPKQSAVPTGGGPAGERPKRVTTASLAASLDQLLNVVPVLSDQIQDLSQKHQMLETRLVAPTRAGAGIVTATLFDSCAAGFGNRGSDKSLVHRGCKAFSHRSLRPWRRTRT